MCVKVFLFLLHDLLPNFFCRHYMAGIRYWSRKSNRSSISNPRTIPLAFCHLPCPHSCNKPSMSSIFKSHLDVAQTFPPILSASSTSIPSKSGLDGPPSLCSYRSQDTNSAPHSPPVSCCGSQHQEQSEGPRTHLPYSASTARSS